MDRLRAYILILHAKVERERLRARIANLESRKPMTPKVRGLAGAMAKLHHDLDAQAGKLLDRVEGVKARGGEAFKKAHAVVDAGEQSIKDVEQFVEDLEGTNGGPTLDDSQGSSEPQPHASWAGKP